MNKLTTRFIIAILTFMLGFIVTTLWYLKQFPTRESYPIAPNTELDKSFFRDIEKCTKKVNLPSLKAVALDEEDLEVRFWDISLKAVNGVILQRSNGKWAAKYLYQVYNGKPSSVKIENIGFPKSGWDVVWKRLISEGLLTFSDGNSKEKCQSKVLDGVMYVVETNVNREYKTFSYSNPQYAECDEAKRIVLIEEFIADEFNLYKFWENLASKVAEEQDYWKILDKTKLDELKTYVTKYPNGAYIHLAKANIRNIEAVNLIETVSNNTVNDANKKTAKLDPTIDKKITGEFVFISSGDFIMGTNDHYSEQPAHKVIISKSFEIGRYEVTQEQWELVTGNNPSYFKGDKRLPIENVSWDDIQKFIDTLNSKSKKYTYRLPTEAEWEYAASAGAIRDYKENLDTMAWYAINSGDEQLKITEDNFDPDKIDSNICRTHPVGMKSPNAWGLYDMQGNVSEWCSDWYENYLSRIEADPSGATNGVERVCRGGSWNSLKNSCRPTFRSGKIPDYHNYDVGFRLVRTVRPNS